MNGRDKYCIEAPGESFYPLGLRSGRTNPLCQALDQAVGLIERKKISRFHGGCKSSRMGCSVQIRAPEDYCLFVTFGYGERETPCFLSHLDMPAVPGNRADPTLGHVVVGGCSESDESDQGLWLVGNLVHDRLQSAAILLSLNLPDTVGNQCGMFLGPGTNQVTFTAFPQPRSF